MGNAEKNRPTPLEVGQLWKLEHGYLFIVELGDRLIRYKILRQPHTSAITQMMRIEALVNFLAQSEAELVPNDAAAPLPYAPWLLGTRFAPADPPPGPALATLEAEAHPPAR